MQPPKWVIRDVVPGDVKIWQGDEVLPSGYGRAHSVDATATATVVQYVGRNIAGPVHLRSSEIRATASEALTSDDIEGAVLAAVATAIRRATAGARAFCESANAAQATADAEAAA